MPEGDAVWRTARQLHRALAGERLVASDLRVPSLATRDLAGRETLEVVPRGKHLLHRLAGGITLHSHLRMEGSWRVVPGSRPPGWAARHTVRAVLRTASHVAIGDRLGMLDVVPTAQEHRVVGHLGPDLLDPGFDRDRALANLRQEPGRPIAEALLDQRNLAGIGTIFAAEPLFAHGVHPWAPVGELPDGTLDRLVDVTRRWLVLSCRAGRPTVGSPPGEPRVHGRQGLACPRCGHPVRVAPLGRQPRQRVLFYCPTCQGGHAPGDDGRPQAPLGHRR